MWLEIYVRREEKRKRRVYPSPLGCVEEKNEAAIYRRIERKKKTMKEIKKEKEEKWNFEWKKRNGKWYGGKVVMLKLTIYLGKRNQTLMMWEESNKYSVVRWLKIWG